LSSIAPSPERIFVGTLAELTTHRVLVARLAPDSMGRPREVIVLLDDSDVARAYLNHCRHLPIPLDAGSRSFVVRGELQCATHGARFRLNDGYCVSGPCRGLSLFKLPVEIATTLVFVIDRELD
jgi:nitrite reductase/ring-hydroxylating ferredoxin subunit